MIELWQNESLRAFLILLLILCLLLIFVTVRCWLWKFRFQALSEGVEQEKELAWKEVEAENREWRQNETERIRREAVWRSKNVLRGQVYEQWVPFAEGFPFNPKDARFLGSPIDYIVFDGLEEGELREILLLEIKSGNAKLSEREAMIREAIQKKHVRFQELRVYEQDGEMF